MEPLYAMKLRTVEVERLRAVTLKRKPKRNIDMARRHANCFCNCQKNWIWEQEVRCNTKLLLNLALNRLCGCFSDFHMPAGRQPKSGVDVVDKKNPITVDQGKIRY